MFGAFIYATTRWTSNIWCHSDSDPILDHSASPARVSGPADVCLEPRDGGGRTDGGHTSPPRVTARLAGGQTTPAAASRHVTSRTSSRPCDDRGGASRVRPDSQWGDAKCPRPSKACRLHTPRPSHPFDLFARASVRNNCLSAGCRTGHSPRPANTGSHNHPSHHHPVTLSLRHLIICVSAAQYNGVTA